jgi:hypothetical protein
VAVGSGHRPRKREGESTVTASGIDVLQVQTQYLLGFYYVYICLRFTGFYKHLRHDPSF